MSNTEATLRDMAKMTMLTNRISEIQEKNLKMFPLAFFEGVSSATCQYDFSNKAMVDIEEDKEKLTLNYKFKDVETKHFLVSYRLHIKEDVLNPHLDKRFTALENAVRTLFWKQVRVEVFFNDNKVFESAQ